MTIEEQIAAVEREIARREAIHVPPWWPVASQIYYHEIAVMRAVLETLERERDRDRLDGRE